MGSLADETSWMDAIDQAALVRSGEVSAAELIEAAIERIEAIDPALNAVIIRWFDDARSCRRRTCPDGPFHGVPFLLKDLWAALRRAAAHQRLPRAEGDAPGLGHRHHAGRHGSGRPV